MLQQDAFRTWRQALPQEGVVVWAGHRRTGKTRSAWGMAETLHGAGRPVLAYRFPKRLRRILPRWVRHAESLEALKRLRGYVIVADEMAHQAHAREHSTTENREWAKMLATVAQSHHLLLAIYQHSRQMDPALAMDGDLMIFKQPSMLHIRFARPELRPEIQEAVDRFQAVKRDPREWAFVVDWHRGKKGFVRCPSPSFWSEELSTAYALALVEEAEAAERRTQQAARRDLSQVAR